MFECDAKLIVSSSFPLFHLFQDSISFLGEGVVFPLLEAGKHNDDLHPLPDKIVIKPAVCGHCSQGLCILSKGKSGKWHAELKPELPVPNGTFATLQHFSPKLLSEEIRVFSRDKEMQKHPHQSSAG